MKNKKNDKVNLEKKRGLFLQIGLIIAFSVILFAFEWATPVIPYNNMADVIDVDMETELVPITRVNKVKPPPPKHYKKIEIIPDTEKPKEELMPENVSLDPDEPVFINIPEEIEDDEDDDSGYIHILPQVMPTFPGGIAGLKKFIVKNVKYPKIAAETNIQGKIYVRFVVNSKGKTEQVSIIRGVDPILDKEALRVVKSFPKWKPGLQNGKAVNVWYTVPIVFQLQK